MKMGSQSFGEKLLASIISLIAVVVLPILLLIVVLPVFTIRKLVARLALIVNPEFSKILTHRSTNLAFEEFHAHTENAILVDNVLEGNYPLESFKKTFSERVLNRKLPNGKLKYPEFRQFVVKWMDFKFWKNENNFDIDEHIRLYNDSRPSGSDEFVTEKEFHAMRSALLNSPFPKNKSPWEFVIVHNYLPDDPNLRGRTKNPLSVWISKTHHALGDGYSLKKLLILDLYGNQEMRMVSTHKPKKNCEDSCAVSLKAVKTLWNCMGFPIRCVYEFISLSLRLMKKGPWHVEESRQAPAVHAFTKILSVARVKRIKDQLGVSFSCILFHICNEAMQKMMAKKGMKLSDSEVALIPLPLPNHPNKLRIHMTHGTLHLPTSPELNPQQRLQDVHSQYEQLRSSTIPFSVDWVTLIIGGMFTSLGRLLASGLVPTIIISNFPGGQNEELSLDGHKCVSSFGNVGLLNLSGLGLMIMTTRDDLKFGVTANSNILTEDEVREFANTLEREVNLLEDEIFLRRNNFRRISDFSCVKFKRT